MLIFVFALIALVLAALLLFASTRPDNFHVERSVTIDAPPEKIFPFINDFRQWDAWTPFDKDPAIKKTYSDSTIGKGAHFAWEGNKKVGIGNITITDSMPPHALLFELHMIKPFEGRNHAAIRLAPVGDATRVTWSLDDKHRLMLKTMRLFMNLDKLIGKDFEVGLHRLKALAEKQ
jgi:uncharacterized protein YndB with AHSA1/START domain